MDSLVAFLPVAVMMVLVPGVNNMVVLQRTLAAGTRGGLAATAGASLGIVVWAGLVAAGLGAVLQGNPDAWALVRWVGAGVVIGLGVRGLLGAALRGGRVGATPHSAGGRSFLPALSTSVLNPRAGITALALLPQFVEPTADASSTTMVLGVAWAALAAVWNAVGVCMITGASRLFERPRGRRIVDGLGGVVMIAVGFSVAFGG